MFTETFFETLPTDVNSSLKVIANKFFYDSERNFKDFTGENRIEPYIDAFAVLETFLITNELDSELPIPNISNVDVKATVTEFYRRALSLANQKIQENILLASRLKYRTLLTNAFSYQFDDMDYQMVQNKINELRELITNSKNFDDKYKLRLLKKLEDLQKSLHKKMSNIDIVWGFIGEAGIVLGKFGNDAKPFVDCIKEIIEIVWKVQAAAEGLPSSESFPLINK